MVDYGTTVIPSDKISVLAGGTVSVSVAFENSIGLMGGMDTANGSATAGEVVEVTSPPDASTKFGDGSELHEAVQLAFQQGAGTVYALPVTETQTTETFGTSTATSSGQLSNVPFFDPNVHDEHSISVTDVTEGTSVEVNIVYADGSPPQPSPSNTINIDKITGQWSADSTSEYEIQYTYGDYSATAMTPLLDESPRMVNVLTEDTSVINDLATELNSRATNFDFMHGVVGARPNLDPSNYSDSIDERRITMVYPCRGYTDSAETNEVRTTPAVGGYLASQALGLSSTNDEIGGLASLKNELQSPTEAGNIIDDQVMPLLDYPPVTIVKDMTTSSEPKFERVYAMQVIDEATEVSHIASRNFVGEQNTEANRQSLRRSHANAYLTMENGEPPMLDDFTVTVKQDTADDNVVNVSIGLDVVDVMDTVDVTITVGDIVRGVNVQ